MRQKITISMLLAAMFLLGTVSNGYASFTKEDNGGPYDESDNPNFTYITNFNEEGDETFFRVPSGSGQTTGIINQDEDGEWLTNREWSDEEVNPNSGSIGAMKVYMAWDDDIEWEEPSDAGFATHYIRMWSEPSNADVEGKRFYPGQAVEVWMYAENCGNRFKFMARDGNNQLEGSHWITIDWHGWKRLTWNYNIDENVHGWVTGDGTMDWEEGQHFYFDSFHFTRSEDGTSDGGTYYFDDFRIVDPFGVTFSFVEGGTDLDSDDVVIALNGTYYEEGDVSFEDIVFPTENEFFAYKPGYETYFGTFDVDNEDVEVEVELSDGEDDPIAVNFDVYSDITGQAIDDAVITLNETINDAGDYAFTVPSSGYYSYTVTRDDYLEYEGEITVLEDKTVVVYLTQMATDNVFLSWHVSPVEGENYSVYVGAEGSTQPEDFTRVFTETLSESDKEFQERVVDISQFGNQDIRVAFRHHDVEDMEHLAITHVQVHYETAETQTLVYLMDEDFSGGIPEGYDHTADDGSEEYDPEWLPEGWESVDANNDGMNWYFAITGEGDETNPYHGEMRSDSHGDLTPDNWLFSNGFHVPNTNLYAIEFEVIDEDEEVLDNATVTVNGITYPEGATVIQLPAGTHDYVVMAEGYVPSEGTFEVTDQDMTLQVIMELIPVYEVNFTVTMEHDDDFAPGETTVYINGNFPDINWATPGDLPEQEMDPDLSNIFLFHTTFNLPAGEYEYKYFNQPSWDGGEWPGGDNRTLVVESDTSVFNVFGFIDDDPNYIQELEAGMTQVYPNPAREMVNIVSELSIEDIHIYNMAGQQIYQQKPARNNYSLDISELNQGFYLVRVFTSEGVASHKLQVIK